jgi:hypothetical protein
MGMGIQGTNFGGKILNARPEGHEKGSFDDGPRKRRSSVVSDKIQEKSVTSPSSRITSPQNTQYVETSEQRGISAL